MMNRREAVERMSLILGGTLSTQLTAALMGQVLNEGPSVEVSDAQQNLLAELADVIIPATDTPGAKEAGAEQFIIRVLRDCHPIEEQKTFYAGLARIDEASQKAHGKNFVDLTEEQKNSIVEDAVKNNKAFFSQMKRFTITGYFTSEIGATQALAYLPIPGRFEGDIPLTADQKTWAESM